MNLGEPVTFDENDVVARIKVYRHPFPVTAHVFNYASRTLSRPLEFDQVKVFHAAGDSTPADVSENGRLTMVCQLNKFGSDSFRADTADQPNIQYSLLSSPFPSRSNYLLGFLSQQSLFLTPVTSVHHFSQTLSSQQKPGSEMGVGGPYRVEEKFGSKYTTDENVASERTVREVVRQRSYMLNKESANAKEYSFSPIQSPQSIAFRRQYESIKGWAPLPSARPANTTVSHTEDLFFPPEILSSGGITGGDEMQYSVIRAFANTRSIKELVIDLIQRTQVLTFTEIKSVVDSSRGGPVSSEAVILECLASSSVYMHGVWVSRRNPRFSGVGAAIRELVLASFFTSEDGCVVRKDLNQISAVASHRTQIKEILETIATLEGDTPGGRFWRLKGVGTKEDTQKERVRAFLEAFGKSIHYDLWQKKMAQTQSHKNYIHANRAPPTLFLQSPEEDGRPAAAMTTVNATESSSNATDESALLPIKSYIDEIFNRYGVLNKSRAKEMILKGRDSHYPHATNAMLSQALQSSVIQFTANTWVRKTSDQPLVNEYRPKVLEIISALPSFTMNQLQEKLGEEPMSKVASIPTGVLKAIVEEVAEFRISERVYYVKTGSLMNEN